MRITFDITSAVKPEPTGIGNYVVDLINAVFESDSANHYSLGIRPKRFLRKKYVQGKFSRSRVAFVPLIPPLYPVAGKIDVFHALGVRLPKYGSFKKVVTVHDINTLETPELSRSDWAEKRGERIAETIARADAIVVPSEFTKQRILSRFSFPDEWIRTIYHGVDQKRYFRRDEAEIQAYLKKEKLDRPYLLHIGAYVPRKNKLNLVRAFAQSWAKKDGLLVLAGSKRGNFAEVAAEVEKLGISDKVRFLGFVERDEIALLLAGARLFAFPSFYEGFGLPVIEAMSVGTPVIAAHASSLPEVGGDTIGYFDPNSVEDMLSCLNRFWEDDKKRQELAKRALQRASEFTWKRAAKQSLSLYQDLHQEWKPKTKAL